MPVKLAALAAILLGICAGLLFFTMGEKAASEQPPVQLVPAKAPQPADTGDAFFKVDPAPADVSAEPFVDGDGKPVTLADFKGKIVLVNFWATWCAPCIQELPSLARLKAKQGTDGIAVIAINLDRKETEVPIVEALKDYGAEGLEPYVDASQKLMRGFHIAGLPTTLLIDESGHEIARREGEAEWDSGSVMAEITKASAK